MLPLVIWLDIKFHFSNISMVFFLLLATCHSLGFNFHDEIIYYLGFSISNYRMFMHFLFGLLIFHPIYEIAITLISKVKNALLFTLAIIIFFENIGLILIFILLPELPMEAFYIWEIHKGTLLAILGAVLNLLFYTHYKNLLLNE